MQEALRAGFLCTKLRRKNIIKSSLLSFEAQNEDE